MSLIPLAIVAVMFAYSIFRPDPEPPAELSQEVIEAGTDEAGNPYVKDVLGWVRKKHVSETEMGARIASFKELTGVQPYVVLLPYIDGSDDGAFRQEYAEGYFAENIARDDAMLPMFVDASGSGNWEMVCGSTAKRVMNDRATKKFWRAFSLRWNDENYSVPDALERGFEYAGTEVAKANGTWEEPEQEPLLGLKGKAVFTALLIAFAAYKLSKCLRQDRRRKKEYERCEAIKEGHSAEKAAGEAAETKSDADAT